MQNAGIYGIRSFIANSRALKQLVLALFCTIACGLAWGMGAPNASAASYSCPADNFEVTVTDSGDLHVVETRTFEFNGVSDYVAWNYEVPTENGELQMEKVVVRRDGSSDSKVASRQKLEEVPFQQGYPEDMQPDENTYAIDTEYNWVYFFFGAESETVELTMEYTIVNGVFLYKDVAQVYWRYITAGWPADSQNVKAVFELPVPSGVSVVEDDNVYAWGHGPLDGSIDISSKGKVTYSCDKVNAGQFAEARIIFPIDWITNPSESSAALYENTSYRDSAISAEQKWADEKSWLHIQAVVFVAVSFVLSILLLLWGLLMYRRWGVEGKPVQKNEEKDGKRSGRLLEGIAPQLVSRLVRWNKGSRADVNAVVESLILKGAVDVREGACKVGNESFEGAYLVKIADPGSLSESEKLTLDFLFDAVAQDGKSLWARQMDVFETRSPQRAHEFLDALEKALDAEVSQAKLFDEQSVSRKNLVRIVGVAYLPISVIYAFVVANPIPLVGIIVSLALILISHFIARRTQFGVDECAEALALRDKIQGLSEVGSDAEAEELFLRELALEELALALAYAQILGAGDKALAWAYATKAANADAATCAGRTTDMVGESDAVDAAQDAAEALVLQRMALFVRDRSNAVSK